MLICYLDESGDTATLPTPTSDIQPLICIIGVAVDAGRLPRLTRDFIELKKRFFPKKMRQSGSHLGGILVELKGAELRAALRHGNRDLRRHHVGFFDQVFSMLEGNDAKIFGRLWVKAVGVQNNEISLYTSSVQHICRSFDRLMADRETSGVVIADSRNQHQNTRTSFSIFTQKFQAAGDPYPRLAEMPTFGHSENHAGLQLADFLASAILYPLGAYAFCSGVVANVHVHPGYEILRSRYGERLRRLQYRYPDLKAIGGQDGGLVVSDPLGKRGSQHLFSKLP